MDHLNVGSRLWHLFLSDVKALLGFLCSSSCRVFFFVPTKRTRSVAPTPENGLKANITRYLCTREECANRCIGAFDLVRAAANQVSNICILGKKHDMPWHGTVNKVLFVETWLVHRDGVM